MNLDASTDKVTINPDFLKNLGALRIAFGHGHGFRQVSERPDRRVFMRVDLIAFPLPMVVCYLMFNSLTVVTNLVKHYFYE